LLTLDRIHPDNAGQAKLTAENLALQDAVIRASVVMERKEQDEMEIKSEGSSSNDEAWSEHNTTDSVRKLSKI